MREREESQRFTVFLEISILLGCCHLVVKSTEDGDNRIKRREDFSAKPEMERGLKDEVLARSEYAIKGKLSADA